MKNFTGGNVFVTVFYVLLLLTLFLFMDVLRKNYGFYKKIRIKRLFLPIPQTSFYDFSERRIKLAKKYNISLKVLHIFILVTFLYVCFMTKFFRDDMNY